MKKDIISRNEKGKLHGYFEFYYLDGASSKGYYDNGQNIGYHEFIGYDGYVIKRYYIR